MFGVAMVDLDLLTKCTVRITKKRNAHSGNYTEVLLMRTHLNKAVHELGKTAEADSNRFWKSVHSKKRALNVALVQVLNLTMLYIETEIRLLTSRNNTFKPYIHHQHQENLILTGKHMCQTK